MRTARALVLSLLLLPLASGAVHLTRTLRALPSQVEAAASAEPLERHRWLRNAREPARFLARVTAPDARVSIDLDRWTFAAPHGIRYTLFPRAVAAGLPTRSSDLTLHARAGGLGGSSLPANLTWRPAERAECLLPPPDGDAWLVGVVVAARPAGWRLVLRLDGSAHEVPVVGARAVPRSPLRVRGEVAASLVRSTPGEVGHAGDVAAIVPLWSAAPPATFVRYQAGRFLLLGESSAGGVAPDAEATRRALAEGTLWRGVIAIPLLWAAGLVVLRPLPLSGPPALLAGLAWPAGSGTVAALEFAAGWAGVPWGIRLALDALAIGALLLLPARLCVVEAPAPTRPTRVASGLLASGVVLAIACTAATAVLFPRDRWDSFAFWGMKAKEIFLHGRLTEPFLEAGYPHVSYPLLGPILESLVYRMAGGVSDPAAALVGVASLLSATLLIAGGLGRFLPAPWPAAVATAFCVCPRVMHEAAGQLQDVQVAAFALAGVVLFDQAGESLSLRAAAGGLLGLAGFCKNDGLPYAVGGIAAAVLLPRAYRWRHLLASLAATAAVLLPWLAFRALHGLRTDIVNADVLASVSPVAMARQLPVVLRGLLPYAFGFGSPERGLGFDGMFVFAAAALFLLPFVRRPGATEAALLVAASLVLATYLLLPPQKLHQYTNYIQTTGFRILLQVLPSALYVGARALAPSPR